MTALRTTVFFAALCSLAAAVQAAEPAKLVFEDNFTSQKLTQRRAVRGPWRISDGAGTCTQDDQLYKKYKNHGPIIFYNVPTQDAVFSFSIKPSDCKAVVFTLNGQDGHVFRLVYTARGLNVRAFLPEGKTKSIALKHQAGFKLQNNTWTTVVVKLRGEQATITAGKHQPFAVSHATLKTAKTNISIGFSFGTLAVKDFKVTQ